MNNGGHRLHPCGTPVYRETRKWPCCQANDLKAKHSNWLKYRARGQHTCYVWDEPRSTASSSKSAWRQQCIIIGLLNFHLSQFFSTTARVTRGFRFLFGRPFCSTLSSQCTRHSCVGARGRVACALFRIRALEFRHISLPCCAHAFAYTSADALCFRPNDFRECLWQMEHVYCVTLLQLKKTTGDDGAECLVGHDEAGSSKSQQLDKRRAF